MTQEFSGPATLEDLKTLVRALNEQGANYFLIGGYGLFVHGSLRTTYDIDIIVPADYASGVKIRNALLVLPDGAAKDIDPAWFEKGDTIRVGDAFVVDILFKTCGETYETLSKYAETIELEGIPIRTINLEGLLRTKQTLRDKDVADRKALERALEAYRQQQGVFLPDDPNAQVQYVVKNELDPRMLEKTMPGVDADKVRAELRNVAVGDPAAWGVDRDAFRAWGEKHAVGRIRTYPTPAGPKTEVVYDNF